MSYMTNVIVTCGVSYVMPPSVLGRPSRTNSDELYPGIIVTRVEHKIEEDVERISGLHLRTRSGRGCHGAIPCHGYANTTLAPRQQWVSKSRQLTVW